MPLTMTVNGVTLTALTSAWNNNGNGSAISGLYYCDSESQLGIQPMIMPREWFAELIQLTGVPETPTITPGYVTRSILFSAVAIGSNLGDLETKELSLFDALEAVARYPVTLPGGTRLDNCKMLIPAKPGKQVYWGGGYIQAFNVVVTQLAM